MALTGCWAENSKCIQNGSTDEWINFRWHLCSKKQGEIGSEIKVKIPPSATVGG